MALRNGARSRDEAPAAATATPLFEPSLSSSSSCNRFERSDSLALLEMRDLGLSPSSSSSESTARIEARMRMCSRRSSSLSFSLVATRGFAPLGTLRRRLEGVPVMAPSSLPDDAKAAIAGLVAEPIAGAD